MSESRRPLFFIVITLALSATLLGAVAALNATIDPFQQYRLAPAGQARFPRALQRYINPGLAKNADYDFIVTGSSLMENYDLAEINRACGAKSINLAYSAMAASEQRRILELAFRHRSPKRVMMTLDFNSFAPPVDASLPEITDPLPLYLYDENRFNDFRYLLSGSVTMRSLAIMNRVQTGPYSTDFNRAWSWEREAVFSRAHALNGIDPADINRRFKQGPRTIARMRASFDANLAAVAEKHPETQFNLIFPPYSIVAWADLTQRAQLDVSMEFKRYVFQRTETLANVRVFDMQWDRTITHNLDLYTDIYHFNPATNRSMLEFVCGADNRYRVTANSLERFEIDLREQATNVDFAHLSAAAKPQ